MKTFWMVLGYGTPTFRHSTKRAAVAEAERLACLSPAQEFVVLKAEAACRKSAVAWEPCVCEAEPDDGIPF